MLEQLERYEEAIAAYDQIVSLRPGNHQVWFQRGLILEKLGYVQEAVSSYKIVLEIKPDHQNAIERINKFKVSV